ncbi:potassium/sodium hyperpolarization-activated cyclic nucleotide-gated channel 1-like isoform X2 [Salvelinus fontinalis]|uniref:potassium/sodium hyperpolarization-activated cyclic nucleotide-gated channel 1-like isoform X2 n=1 Tax=Salvelinus fontinalis TaxID=8038 RepID=UPI002486573A|nr:potassium/sodium hyperpolarization-activated cyclic nucleotide-gated channel 1-like isoform X2 [Salvelinus fontinalis]
MENSQAPVGRRTASTCGWRAVFLPQLNRQSLSVYGSEIAVEKECIRQLQSGVWVIHPFSPIRSYYIMCMVAITFLNLIGIPMEIAFLDGYSGVGWEGFNVFSDTLFLMDVALNFRMGIISEDSEELQSHSDTSTSGSKASRMVRILMFVRIISLVRLLRVSRLVRFFNEVEKVSNANLEYVQLFFRILSLFMMMFLLCHWNGCIQYFVPMLEEFPSDCWVRQEKLMNATVGEKYSFGVFRALSHMIQISYGSNESPTNEVELWVVMTSMLSGALMYTVLVANAAAIITNVDQAAKAYKDKMNHLDDYMTFLKLPNDLRLRIQKYYGARYGGRWFDEKNFLISVSSALREEILTVMCLSLLNNVPMFQNRDVNFLNTVLLQFQHEVFQEDDVIFLQNAPGDRMFFIEHGQVLVETDSFSQELADGDYFGETCLMTKGKRLATVQALTTCQLFSLSSERFQMVLQGFPDIRRDMEKFSQQDKEYVLHL